MKKLLVLCAGMMLLASAAMAQTNGLQVAWANCQNTAGNTPVATFSCDPSLGEVQQQFFTFSLAAPLPGIIAMDNIVDFIFPDDPTVPAFWQFEGTGCNNGGVTMSAVRPIGVCAGNLNTLCGNGANCPGQVITNYGHGAAFGFPENRARMLLTIARPASAPITVTNTARQFAFVLNYFDTNAPDGAGGGCAGCNASVGITWNNALFYNTAAVGGEATAVVLSSTDPGSFPSSGANCTACASVASKAKTWGQLKSLYR